MFMSVHDTRERRSVRYRMANGYIASISTGRSVSGQDLDIFLQFAYWPEQSPSIHDIITVGEWKRADEVGDFLNMVRNLPPWAVQSSGPDRA